MQSSNNNKNNKNTDSYSNVVYDFIQKYDILNFFSGTLIAFATVNILRDISIDIINPIIVQKFIGPQKIINIKGVDFNIDKILSNVIFTIIIIISLYFIFSTFHQNHQKMITESKHKENMEQQYYVENLQIQHKNNALLQQILDKST